MPQGTVAPLYPVESPQLWWVTGVNSTPVGAKFQLAQRCGVDTLGSVRAWGLLPDISLASWAYGLKCVAPFRTAS